MREKITVTKLAFVLSIIGFMTGFLLIGIILDIVAIVLAIKAIKSQDDKLTLSYVAIFMAAAGIILTVWFYSSYENDGSTNKLSAESVNVEENVAAQNDNVSDIESSKIRKAEETSIIEETKKDLPKVSDDKSEADSTISVNTMEVAPPVNTKNSTKQTDLKIFEYNGVKYQIIEVDGGDRSGTRKSNVAVDVVIS